MMDYMYSAATLLQDINENLKKILAELREHRSLLRELTEKERR